MESTSEDVEPSSVFWTNQRQEYRASQKTGWRREYTTLNEVYTKLSIHELAVFLLRLHSPLPLQQKVPEISSGVWFALPIWEQCLWKKKSMQDPLHSKDKTKKKKKERKEETKTKKQTKKQIKSTRYYFIASFELQFETFFGCADKFLNFTVFVSNRTKKCISLTT